MITPELVEKALSYLSKRTTNYEYFFGRLKSSEWIKPLKDKGFFQKPPEPIKKDGYINYPFWPESQYLSRVADQAPDDVLEIALSIAHKTSNFRINNDFNEAASKMPAELASKWADFEAKWISKQQYIHYLSDSFYKLVIYLAKHKQDVSLYKLLKSVLFVIPDTTEDSTQESLQTSDGYKLRIDIHEYRRILKECLPSVITYGDESCINFICDILKSIFESNSKNKDELSMVWRPAIEENDQNRTAGGIESALITSIRDACDFLITKYGKTIFEILESYKLSSLFRISIYLRSKYPQYDLQGTEQIVCDENIIDSSLLHHEIYYLLKNNYGIFSNATKSKYLDYISNKTLSESYLSWHKENFKREFTPQEAEKHLKQKQYKFLHPISEYLEGKYLDFYKDCLAEFGPLDHADFEFYISTGWTGPTSPKDSAALGDMTITDIIDFLQDWKPKGDYPDDSFEGLGRTLSETVKNNPDKFISQAVAFKSLDPTYTRSLLQGFQDALKDVSTFNWPPVIDLMNWIVEQPIDIPDRKVTHFDKDPDWQWTRKGIASLIQDGFNCKCQVPIGFRNQIWDILNILSFDPDPTPEYEEEYGGTNLDPPTLAINTTRGKAMHAVVHYALWVRRNSNEPPNEGFTIMPEVKSCLQKHLDIQQEPSTTIRSVYGQYLPWLITIDKDWCQNHLGDIFPKEPSSADLYCAAWFTYLAFCQPFDESLSVLKSEYAYSIENFSTNDRVVLRIAEPINRLGEHLLTFYLRGLISTEANDLIDMFFNHFENEEANKHSLDFLGRCLQNKEHPMPKDYIQRAIILWEWRISALERNNSLKNSIELQAFESWFSADTLDDKWVIKNMMTILKHQKVKLDYNFTERFPKMIEQLPLDSLNCLEAIIVNDTNEYGFYDYKDHIKATLKKALVNPNISVQEKAKGIVDILTAKGYLNYRLLIS